MKPQFLIAAPHSGAGKTTVTLGILRALHNRGLQVQPFKCGPDYLDPKLHTLASGKQSINLDRFMMDDTHITELYAHYGSKADALVTEGVMGLFDGAVKMEGSSADLASLLHIPIIMVVNAKAMAYSVAALLLGFKTLRRDLTIAGVIFNFVEHESHYRMLKEAAEDVGITALGYLPNNAAVQIPSRHLGLKTGTDIDLDKIVEQAAAHVAKYVDLDALIQLTMTPLPEVPANVAEEKKKDDTALPVKSRNGSRNSNGNNNRDNSSKRRILVANDEAFNFTYTENIAALSALGEVQYFSPLKDTLLPQADLIYLPGGYPELHLEALSDNKVLRDQLYAYYSNGGKILAECGGMMYLGEYIADELGKSYPMAGILKIATSMQQKKLSLGYKRLCIDGIEFRGHEFHYSQFIDTPKLRAIAKGNVNIQIWNARNEPLELPVFQTPNLLASYFHIYFGNKLEALETLLFS